MGPEGGSVKRWVLAGTDYVYPRTTNKILEAYLAAKADDLVARATNFARLKTGDQRLTRADAARRSTRVGESAGDLRTLTARSGFVEEAAWADPKGVFRVEDGVIHISGEEFGCLTTEK